MRTSLDLQRKMSKLLFDLLSKEDKEYPLGDNELAEAATKALGTKITTNIIWNWRNKYNVANRHRRATPIKTDFPAYKCHATCGKLCKKKSKAKRGAK